MFWEFLRPFFEWSYNTSIGEQIRDSLWAFAILEVFHLIGLTVVLGAIGIFGLRLLDLTMRDLPLSKVARETAPWAAAGFGLMLLSGVPMYMSEAIKCFNSGPFRIKMVFLCIGIVLIGTLYRKVTGPTEARIDRRIARIAGGLVLTLWLGVAIAGRAIGFF